MVPMRGELSLATTLSKYMNFKTQFLLLVRGHNAAHNGHPFRMCSPTNGQRISNIFHTRSIKYYLYWISRKNCLELIELSSINNVNLVWVFSCNNTGSIRNDPYWTSRKNTSELIELSSINKVSLV